MAPASAGIGGHGGGGRDSRLAVTDRGGAGRRQVGGAVEGCDREHLPLAADLDLVARKFGKVETGASDGLVGDDELAIIILGQRFEPAGGVDGVADRGDRGGFAVPHLADDHRPAMDADADAQWTVELGPQ